MSPTSCQTAPPRIRRTAYYNDVRCMLQGVANLYLAVLANLARGIPQGSRRIAKTRLRANACHLRLAPSRPVARSMRRKAFQNTARRFFALACLHAMGQVGED